MAKALKKDAPVDLKDCVKWIRIVKCPMKPQDTVQGFQVETMYMYEDTVVKRELVGKPNTFLYIQNEAIEMIDPEML